MCVYRYIDPIYISSLNIIKISSVSNIYIYHLYPPSLSMITVTHQYELDYHVVSMYFLIQMMMIKYY
jgi:hypothetical protein